MMLLQEEPVPSQFQPYQENDDMQMMGSTPEGEADEKISEITQEIIEQILTEYPRIQSLDFSNNLLTGI